MSELDSSSYEKSASGIHAAERFGHIAMVARWKPVHNGHELVLRGLCHRASQVKIGIGSSNCYDARNPFTAAETADMIRLALDGRSNVTLIDVPDLNDGPRWWEMVRRMFGPLDLFVTANPYVAHLLAGDFRIAHPVHFVAQHQRVPIDGTLVRRLMARGENWRELVPQKVANYIEDKQLDKRFQREFGLRVLALDAGKETTNVFMG